MDANLTEALHQTEQSAKAVNSRRDHGEPNRERLIHTSLDYIRQLNDAMKHPHVDSRQVTLFFEIDDLITVWSKRSVDNLEKRLCDALRTGWTSVGGDSEQRAILPPVFPPTISATEESIKAISSYTYFCSARARQRISVYLSDMVRACQPHEYQTMTDCLSMLSRVTPNLLQTWELLCAQRQRTFKYLHSGFCAFFSDLERFVAHGVAHDIKVLNTLRSFGLQKSITETLQLVYIDPYTAYVQAAFSNKDNNINTFTSVIVVLIELTQRIKDQLSELADDRVVAFVNLLPTTILQPLSHSLNVCIHEHLKSLVSSATYRGRVEQSRPIRLTSSHNIVFEVAERGDQHTSIPQRGISSSVVNLLRSLHPLLPLLSLQSTAIKGSAVPFFKDQVLGFVGYLSSLTSMTGDACVDLMVLGSLLFMKSQLIPQAGCSSQLSMALYQVQVNIGGLITEVRSHIVRRHDQHCRSYILATMHNGSRGYTWQRAESIFQIKSASNYLVSLNLFFKGLALDLRTHLPLHSWVPVFLEIVFRCSLSLMQRFSYISPSRGMARQYKVDLLTFIMTIRSVTCGVETLVAKRQDMFDEAARSSLEVLLSHFHGIVSLCVLQLMVVYGDADQIETLLVASRKQSRSMDADNDEDKLVHVQALSSVLQPASMDFTCATLNPVRETAALDQLCQSLVDLEVQPRALGLDWVQTLLSGLSLQQLLLFCSKRPELREDESPQLSEDEVQQAARLKEVLMSTQSAHNRSVEHHD